MPDTTNRFVKVFAEMTDTEIALAAEAFFALSLGPKALDVQTTNLPSCAREYAIRNDLGEILLFLRGPGVRYGNTNHLCGTTVQEKRAGKPVWDFVREKYKLEQCSLSDPYYVGFDEISKGTNANQCLFGDVWTQIFNVHYDSGPIPANAAWYSPHTLPENIIPYHAYLIRMWVAPRL